MLENTTKLNLNWSAVEKALAEGTFSGYKIGVLETEKLFNDFLNQKKIPGRNIETKIKYVKDFLSRAEQLKYGREIYKKIIQRPNFGLSQEETKQAIGGYWQAMLDLEEAIVTLSVWEKLKLKYQYFLGLAEKKIKLIGLIFALTLVVILFLNDLNAGRKTALAIGSAAHFFVFKIGPWILGAALVVSLFWLGMKILKKKREF
ncbi:MAG: hypothetical protein HY764_00845 [Candidatus Portnoybacteria bacterium]|nr:hypothetical protein [Candidatus Portnoybacteria bacterium]